MRQEPKLYESTKPTNEAVDTNVVAAQISDDVFTDESALSFDADVEAPISNDGFFEKIYAFLKWIGDNVEFEEYKFDNDDTTYPSSEITLLGYTHTQHMAMDDPFELYGTND